MKPKSNHSNPSAESSISFENAFARLEEILEKMNAETVSLDESLKLYEEADQLIALCDKQLNEAERKIEVLVKNRSGELVLSQDDKPLIENYTITS